MHTNTIDMDVYLTARPASVPLLGQPYRVTLAAPWSRASITADVVLDRSQIRITMLWSAGLGRDGARASLVKAMRGGPSRDLTGTRSFLRAVRDALAEGAVVQ